MHFLGIDWVGVNAENGRKLVLSIVFIALVLLASRLLRWVVGLGSEAIRQLEAYGADVALLFTDIEMPGSMNGFELARRTSARWPEIGILVASGQRQPCEGDMPERAIFVQKPFSSDVVHKRVHEILPDGRKPERLKRKNPG